MLQSKIDAAREKGVNVDLKVAVVLESPENELAPANLSIGVLDFLVPITPERAQSFAVQTTKRFESMRITARDIKVEIRKLGANSALVATYRLSGTAGQSIRQMQALIPGGGKTYIVTCTSGVEEYEHFEPVFERILADLKVPPTPFTYYIKRLARSRSIIVSVILMVIIFGILVVLTRMKRRSLGAMPLNEQSLEIARAHRRMAIRCFLIAAVCYAILWALKR